MRLLKENLANLKFLPVKLSLFFWLAGCMGMAPPSGWQGYGQPPNSNANGQQLPSSGSAPPSAPSSPPRTDSEYDQRKEEDSDREEVLGSSSRRRRGDRCEDESSRHECKRQCRTIYNRVADREDCEELTVNQVDALFEIHKLLEKADDLEDIDFEDFEVYLNVSIAGFDRLISDYKRSEVEDILIWIAEDHEITELLKDEDDDYRTLKKILKQLQDFNDNELERPFKEEIDDDTTLFEAAMDATNEEAVDWFMEFILEEETACQTPASTACLTVFCDIGRAFDDDSDRKGFIDYDAVYDYLSEIIDGNVNGHTHATSDPGNKWCAEGAGHARCATSGTTGYKGIITSVSDIDEGPENYDDFVEVFCGGL